MSNENTSTLSLLVPAVALEAVSKRLGKLAAKAGVSWTVLSGETYLAAPLFEEVENMVTGEVTRIKHWTGRVPCSRIEVGEMPRTSGWKFVARLEHTPAGVLVSCAPGEECPVSYREQANLCEHCNTRRARRDTFVLRGPNGEMKQVGRNCLADFLMCDATQLVKMAEFAAEIVKASEPADEEEIGSWGGGGRYEISTPHYMACVCASVRVNGFRKSAEAGSTKGDAAFLAYPCPWDKKVAKLWKEGQPTEADVAEAALIMAWKPEGQSDYEHNLRIALALPGADTRRMGLLASAPTAYARAQGKLAETVKKASPPVAGHFGAKGERLSFTAVLERMTFVESEWGSKAVCSLRTLEGHALVWFASGECPRQADVGATFAMKGTVKEHGQYNGKAQTVMSRCKFEKISADGNKVAC